ncbi:unnamed protein product [Eruca vesicaria subsp. sativa]|uniref:TIR domain-containing protein n=1 Tax=Eruca vesicaria subsp. sativa TaxID=29727 RepID=A0ABC8JUJ2_ERUVS|nr:unnamed protein product [Eruca vesicaria subsp. sativa]
MVYRMFLGNVTGSSDPPPLNVAPPLLIVNYWLNLDMDDDSKLVDGITEKISKMLFSAKPTNGNNLIGIDEHMNELYPLLDLTSNQGVRVIGIWGRGSLGRSALARHVYENISHNFEAHCLLEDVRRISLHCRRSHLQEELLSKMQGEGLTSKISRKCLKMIKARLRNKKILLVANDVDKIEQLDALGEEFSWFGSGSRIIITTQDRQLLSSSGVKSVYEVEILRCYEVRQLFRSVAFKQKNDPEVRQLFRTLAFKQREDPVGLEEPIYGPMNLPGISFIFTLKYLLALLCDRGQLRERLNAMIYKRNMSTSYDVFLSFRGLDTRSSFIPFLYEALAVKNLRTFKDDKELESGQRIFPELLRAIEESRFAVVVVSAQYAESTWCLEELVKIMELEEKGSLTVIPIFYGVDPCDVRWQMGEVAAQFKEHEAREDHERVLTWRHALTGLANISGDRSLKWGDDLMLIDKVVKRIWRSTDTTTGNGSNIVGIDEHMKAISRLFDLNSKESVRVVGIWARGGNARSSLSKFVYQNICHHFQSHCFLGNLKRISQDHHMSHLHKEFMGRVQGEYCSRRSSFENQKVLLVADDVNKLEQLEALAEDFNSFGPGSIVIITTQDRQLLNAYGIKLVYEVEHLRFQKVPELLRQLSRKMDTPAALGSGSFLRDDDSKLVDGITENINTIKKLFSTTPSDGQLFRSLGFKKFSRTSTDGQFFRSSGFKKRDGPFGLEQSTYIEP